MRDSSPLFPPWVSQLASAYSAFNLPTELHTTENTQDQQKDKHKDKKTKTKTQTQKDKDKKTKTNTKTLDIDIDKRHKA